MPEKPKTKAKPKAAAAKSKLGANRGNTRAQANKAASSSRSASLPRSKRLQSASGSTRSKASGNARNRASGSARSSSSRTEAVTTTNLDEIRKWVEARQGQPATVITKGKNKKQEAGILRIDFPGYSGKDTLKAISWEEWYKKFQEKNLAFLYQEKTQTGKESRFFKLVNKS